MLLLIAETVTTHLTKTMDIIFIDTSIFESNNFLESDRIKEVYKLAERGEIKVVLPELTYDEILNRISKNIERLCTSSPLGTDLSLSRLRSKNYDTIIVNPPPLFSKPSHPILWQQKSFLTAFIKKFAF